MPELRRFGYSLKSRYPLLKFTFYKPWFPCANHTCDWLICNHMIPRGLQLLSAINVQLLFMIRTWLKPVVWLRPQAPSIKFAVSPLLVTENSMDFVLWMYNKACNVWVPGNSSSLFTLESPYFSCLCLRKHWYWRGKQLFPKEPDFKCISNKCTFHELPWLKSTRNLLTRATKGNKEQLKLRKVWLGW